MLAGFLSCLHVRNMFHVSFRIMVGFCLSTTTSSPPICHTSIYLLRTVHMFEICAILGLRMIAIIVIIVFIIVVISTV